MCLIVGERVPQWSLHVHARERPGNRGPFTSHQRHRAAPPHVHDRAPQPVPKEGWGDAGVTLRRRRWERQPQTQNRLVEGERLHVHHLVYSVQQLRKA